MNKYYITPQFIFEVNYDEIAEYGHKTEQIYKEMLTFKANIYRHHNKNSDILYSDTNLCGIKIKDQVLVSIPINTTSIIF